ncbi:molybdopterin converting factor subunit 1 [uncultured Parasphingorhabdus sp.]|uniref:molybdopterin converting factor subunit 1 n=1 Tax=uncultured Parasphingorhabdus sp. TaxID=2709694 RepID=UPI0030D93EF1|tara:strand:- start:49888 stop:50151 length:264 start_codon:yes stop_codon:yes gene_type:complete
MGRSINLLYFAWVRERLGIDGEEISLGAETETIDDVVNMLVERGGAYPDVFSDVAKLRFALDQDYGTLDSPIGSARELAIFPPVTGG